MQTKTLVISWAALAVAACSRSATPGPDAASTPPPLTDSAAPVPPAPAPDAASPPVALDASGPPPAPADAAAAIDGGPPPPAPDGGGGPIDGGPGNGSCAPVETINVAAGAAATFTTALAKDGTFLLKAVGAVDGGGQKVDAEFASSGDGMGMDVVGGVDVGIDVGLLWPNRPTRFTQHPAGPGRMKWNPSPQVDAMYNVTPGALFRADSVYYMIVIGAGRPLSLKLALPTGMSGSGSIAVSLYVLSPPPPAKYTAVHAVMPPAPPPPKTCGDVLDTVYVSVKVATPVPGKFVTDAGKLYLLQASGTAPVGAAGLGDGDAEYMDFGPDVLFNGFNDGEACADFGLGVDETMVGHCGNNILCNHRKNWWGTVGIDQAGVSMFNSPTYRNDHIYYMVYPGTGKPITFTYFDSGYGDNQAFDVMARVFPLP